MDERRAQHDWKSTRAADSKLDDQIDAEYRKKYRLYAANILNSILTPQARAATIKLVP